MYPYFIYPQSLRKPGMIRFRSCAAVEMLETPPAGEIVKDLVEQGRIA